jgi:hypothetical protein
MRATVRAGMWVGCVVMFSTLASAEPQASDKATAQALFDQGKHLASASKFKEACSKFEESQRLDPGIGTQFHLANCYEKAGRTASAWTLFLEVASEARAQKQTDREKVARDRAAALEPKLSKLTISVSDAAKTADLEIKRDGVSVGAAQWGAPLPVDPGTHMITASASHKQPWRTTVEVAAGGASAAVTVTPLRDAPVTAAPAASTSSPSAVPSSVEAPSSGRRTSAILFAGVGTLAMGTGGVLGLLAKSKFKSAWDDGHCDDAGCDPTGLEIQRSAISRGNVATIVAVSGAVLTTAGVVLWLTAPKTEMKVGLSPKEIVLRGTF